MPYAAHMRQEVILTSTRNVPIVRIARESHQGAPTRTRELFVTLSPVERGRLGAAAANAKRTPAQRREISRHAYMTGAVNSVVDRAPDLTPDQLARLRALFAPAVQGARER